ncbi:MAG: efflux RND transporter periplasmic adaptor subunit [Verrucomicrobiota bacterium]
MADVKKRTGRKILIFAVIALALVAAVLYAVFQKRETIITVQTEKVTRRNLTELVVANGKVQPVLQVVIAPEVSGEIVELPVKEGQFVKKGQVLVRIKQDNYLASRRSAQASFQSAEAGQSLAQANLTKADLDFKRMRELYDKKLVSDSQFTDAQAALDVAKASFVSSGHMVQQAKAALDRADDDLSKTTIEAPMDGTVTRLRSQKGERVVGTALMAGTEIMTIANLDAMEARVDIGEVDVILIALGQKARLEVDAFRDRKFTGLVTEIANAAKGTTSAGTAQQEATKFEVKIRIQEKEAFRPGMSVTAEVETRSRTNVLTVPIQSVTTRAPKVAEAKTNAVAGATNSAASTNAVKVEGKKAGEAVKQVEGVFVVTNDVVRMTLVKRGISDDTYVEITDGLKENQEVISGGYKAINRELEDGVKIKRGTVFDMGSTKDERDKEK